MAKRPSAGVKPAPTVKPAAGVKPEVEKRGKLFEEVGEALKMLERPLLKRDPADEHKELVEAMQVWREEAELGEEIQKRHAAKPKAQGRWNRKDRAEDEAELMRAAKAARVEVMEKEEEEYEDEKEEEGVKEAEEDDMEKDDGGGDDGGGCEEQQGGEGTEEEGPEQDEEVNPDEGAGQAEPEMEDDEGQQQKGWWDHHQGWWKRNWHKGKGKNNASWQPRQHKPHWASWKTRQRNFSGGTKGTGKGKFDAWGGEYCIGGYKDLAGNFYARL